MLRIDFEQNGRDVDDLAIGGDHVHMVRLERMDSGTFWGCVYLKDGRTLRLGIQSSRKVTLTGDWE